MRYAQAAIAISEAKTFLAALLIRFRILAPRVLESSGTDDVITWPRPNPSPASVFRNRSFWEELLPKSLNHRSARVRVPEPDQHLSDAGASIKGSSPEQPSFALHPDARFDCGMAVPKLLRGSLSSSSIR